MGRVKLQGMVNEERLVALFKKLCLINAPALEERDCVDYVKAHLTEMGLDVSEDNAGSVIGGNAGNVTAVLKGTNPHAPRIFFSAHFDTVEPTEGLVIQERDGVLYSSGDTILGADDKAGMAPAIEAVQHFLDSGEERGDIVLLFTVAEEIGLKGADALDIKGVECDFGYVLDTGPPVGTFVNRTANHDKLDVMIHGRPAHAGKHPEEGINAIQVMADAISTMKLGRISEETTANFGIVSGGTAVNVVCPFVHLRGEARSTSAEALEKQIDHMIQELERAAAKWGAEVEIDHKRHYSAYEVDPGHKCIAIAQHAAQTLNIKGDLSTTLGGSDANVFNAKGVPTIVVATGMDKIHTHEEFVARGDLVKTTELVIEIVREANRASKTS